MLVLYWTGFHNIPMLPNDTLVLPIESHHLQLNVNMAGITVFEQTLADCLMRFGAKCSLDAVFKEITKYYIANS
jgi:hypothetical protein